ncbi:MAG: hypothetical protein SGI77_22510 [Pirellulaceae bacterium]|nr:hypothetical protein [Pirellulaceae bacterium]
MSGHEFFGVLRNTVTVDRRQIVAVGVFNDHPSNDLRIPTNGHEEYIGHTNCVHWYLNDNDSAQFNRLPEGSLVKFHCDPNYDNPDTAKDRRRVSFMSVDACGGLVLPESDCNGWQDGGFKLARLFPNGTCYIRASDHKTLIGPWRITTNQNVSIVEPKQPAKVFRYDIDQLRNRYEIRCFDHPLMVRTLGTPTDTKEPWGHPQIEQGETLLAINASGLVAFS